MTSREPSTAQPDGAARSAHVEVPADAAFAGPDRYSASADSTTATRGGIA